ncbi:MAG: tetratricopeptide repeat protein [Myxococcota bacterium]
MGRTDRPLARAGAHLSAGRIAEAEGAYSAILSIDPDEVRAHLGLADCANVAGDSNRAVDHLVEHAQRYAEQGTMPAAFTLMTKALAIAPSRLDLHIDVAELEAAAGRVEMAAQRLDNLARSYEAAGDHDEAMLIRDAAEAFRAPAPPPAPPAEPTSRPPFIVPQASAPRTTPPPPPAASANRRITSPPNAPMVRRSPLLEAAAPPPPPKKKRPSGPARISKVSAAPRWRPSAATKPAARPSVKAKPVAAAPRPSVKAAPKAAPKARPAAKARISVKAPPRPKKAAKPIATIAKKLASIAPAPSPKRGGKKLDKLPPLKGPGLAARLRQASRGRDFSEDESTRMWQRPAIS